MGVRAFLGGRLGRKSRKKNRGKRQRQKAKAKRTRGAESGAKSIGEFVPGSHRGGARSCGECSACCELLHVPDTTGWGRRCAHQVEDSDGCCSIYADRPAPCQAYSCGWLDSLGAPEERPDQVGFMFHFDPVGVKGLVGVPLVVPPPWLMVEILEAVADSEPPFRVELGVPLFFHRDEPKPIWGAYKIWDPERPEVRDVWESGPGRAMCASARTETSAPRYRTIPLLNRMAKPNLEAALAETQRLLSDVERGMDMFTAILGLFPSAVEGRPSVKLDRERWQGEGSVEIALSDEELRELRPPSEWLP